MYEKSAAVAFVVLTMLAYGCNDGSARRVDSSSGAPREIATAPGLVAQAMPPISDLPVPFGFNLDEPKSRNFRGGPARYVDHVYVGGADKFAVARFYLRQMPVQRWTLVTDMFVQGDVMIDFRKQNESCRIIVSDADFLSFKKSQIRVTLWTTGPLKPAATEAPGDGEH